MFFNRDGIIFVLQHLKELRQGERVERHTSYLERPLVTRSRSLHAPFEDPCLVAAEVTNRLDVCGPDGFFCKVYFALEETQHSIGRVFNLPDHEVDRGIRSALAYVSFKWPKNEDYGTFRRKRVGRIRHMNAPL